MGIYNITKNGELFDAEKYNFSDALNSGNIQDVYNKSGMRHIVSVVESQLTEKKILSSLFIEFNLLGTILDPTSKDELNSFTFFKGTSEFTEGVKNYSNKIIRRLNEKNRYTLFYNPNVFLDQTVPQILYSASDNFKKTGFKEDLDKDTDKEHYTEQYFNENGVYFGSSKFTRRYDEILENASKIREENHDTEKEFKTFHSYYHECIPNNGRTVYLAVPILGSPSSNRITKQNLNNVQGQGVVFLFFDINKSYNGNLENDIIDISEVLFDRIGDIVRTLTYNYLFNVGLNLSEAVKKESIKSAISAIMSRNMSHNLGSHYLYYTKAHLEEMARHAEKFGPDIRGAAKVLGYIQGRMDYLATLISTDKYPYAPVNFKSQLLDDLTIDSSSRRHYVNNTDERTTNFLLTNLILSENFTRPDITDDNEQSPFDLLRLQVKYKKDNDSPYLTFTGTNNELEGILPTMKSEKEIKNALAHLNVAMPGGAMSCHAFYNILENFIRNSAKYRREDFETEERYLYDADKDIKCRNLNITIGIKKHTDGCFVDFIIYDNKANAVKGRNSKSSGYDCLLTELNRKLSEIKILNPDNSINKDNKGLKEMLFSAAWMRAYSFEKDKNYADIIADIQSIPDSKEKLKEINQHCFSFVAVKDSGEDIQVLEEGDINEDNCREPLNLGLLFTMPIFLNTSKLKYSENTEQVINESLSLFADVAVTDKETPQLSNIYTRLYCGEFDENLQEGTSERDLNVLKIVLKNRFPDIDEYRLVFGTNSDKDTAPDDRIIKFKHHMNSQELGHLEENLKFAYADSVSGGDFTKTLNELFDNGNPEIVGNQTNYSYNSPEDEYFALKIKESALTKITIIDERLYNNVEKRGEAYGLELTLKNLRVLNYKEQDKIDSVLSMFAGNKFKDGKQQTHFLSIHLGIIEKILKSKEFNVYISEKDKSLTTLDQKARFLMNSLKEAFGGKETFITVHSGRGNFSRELEGPLDTYPFISLSSIESAFNNCKYLLSQLFYTTRYVGKGVYNK